MNVPVFQCTVWWVFEKYGYLCNYHHNQGIEYLFQHPLVFTLVNLPSPTPGKHWSDFYQYRLFFPILEPPINEIRRKYVFFSIFFCTVKHIQDSAPLLYASGIRFLFTGEQCSSVWRHRNSFIHHGSHGDFDYLQCGAVITKLLWPILYSLCADICFYFSQV